MSDYNNFTLLSVPQSLNTLYMSRYEARKFNGFVGSFDNQKPFLVGFKYPYNCLLVNNNASNYASTNFIFLNSTNNILYKITFRDNQIFNEKNDAFYHINKNNALNTIDQINSMQINIAFSELNKRIAPVHFTSTEAVFNELYSEWEKQTKFQSLIGCFENTLYKKIIQLGFDVVPYIIKLLRKEPGHIFIALNKITGENPVKSTSQGNIKEMANDWINWWDKKVNVVE
jgi:hypothetical protein